MSTDLAIHNPGIQINSIDELARVADMFAKSGMFQDAKDAAQAGVKIMAGQAWGIDPFSAMTAIHLIQGRPTISAGVMAAKVKGHPKYDFLVKRLDGEACAIEFFEGKRSLGVSTFTIEDAKAAGYASKSNWKQTPRNMLFARALSNGLRWYTPDVFSSSVYTPEDFNQEGEAVERLEAVDVTPSRSERPVAASEPEAEPESPPEPAEDEGEALATAAQLKALGASVKEQQLTREDAIAFFTWLTGRALVSSKELTKAEASRVIAWDGEAWLAALNDYAAHLGEEESA